MQFSEASCYFVGRYSVQGLATWWVIRRSNITGGRDFPQPFRTTLGPTHSPVQWLRGFSTGVKRPGSGVDHQPSTSAEVKKKSTASLHLYSPSRPSWPVLEWALSLHSYYFICRIWIFLSAPILSYLLNIWRFLSYGISRRSVSYTCTAFWRIQLPPMTRQRKLNLSQILRGREWLISLHNSK